MAFSVSIDNLQIATDMTDIHIITPTLIVNARISDVDNFWSINSNILTWYIFTAYTTWSLLWQPLDRSTYYKVQHVDRTIICCTVRFFLSKIDVAIKWVPCGSASHFLCNCTTGHRRAGDLDVPGTEMAE